MSILEHREQDYNFNMLNGSGGELAIGHLVLINEQFGEVVNLIEDDKTSPPAPVPDGERMLVNCTPAREIQVPDTQLDSGDTFAKDAKVYMEPGYGDLLDAPTASTRFVGIVTQALGSNSYIYMKTVTPLVETV